MVPRRDVVNCLLVPRREDLLVVAGLGTSAWDVCASGDHAGNFCFIGAMGQAAPFALGLALARPRRRCVLITGDGDLLMALGSLATIARHAPSNLALVVLDNEAYQETGAQATATAGPTDLAAIAAAAGFPRTLEVIAPTQFAAMRELVIDGDELCFVNVKVRLENLPRVFPHSFDGVTAINRFRDAASH